ncbi:Peptide methionine sulfoxide reductase [Mesomycoplasma dispar]|uniref:peptide-methionine (R)-S-oxide reductase n=1 Tax=Mesomycoplasma dispar TaxID=86660 RepID=A0AAJ5NLN7_9BACT|nr:peptide-methionine (R)-S-oxide reductase MsrB [Mesomycoplasma dispar]AJR12408.1 methionine sulfoxide reductase B [Mesomycoplasma dispar]VEU62492.1 Peptide methionine sulfoxide reductase [Mesomycoplasma dispar]
MDNKKKLDHLSDLQYKVTQENFTEPAFDNLYNDNYQEGVYVDVVDGTPLFLSINKYDSGSGWPSFWKPIDENEIVEVLDFSHSITRIEVRSKKANSHLGHVFNDGPKKEGGRRYCINSAALKFIPKSELKDYNLVHLLKFFESK